MWLWRKRQHKSQHWKEQKTKKEATTADKARALTSRVTQMSVKSSITTGSYIIPRSLHILYSMLLLLKVRTLWNINAHKLLKLKVIFKCGNYSNENKSPKTGLLSTVVAQTNATKEVGRSSVCYQPRLHETLKVNEQIKAFWPPSAVWPVRKTKLCHLILCHDGRWVWQELRACGWAQGWLFNSLSSLQAIPTAATQPNRNMGLGYTLVQTTDCIFHLLYIQNLKINSRFPKQLILDKKSRISCQSIYWLWTNW